MDRDSVISLARKIACGTYAEITASDLIFSSMMTGYFSDPSTVMAQENVEVTFDRKSTLREVEVGTNQVKRSYEQVVVTISEKAGKQWAGVQLGKIWQVFDKFDHALISKSEFQYVDSRPATIPME